MKYLIHSFLVIYIFIPFLLAQNDNNSSSDTDIKNINIPLGTWSINDLNSTERTLICDQQKSYCINDCGSNQLTKLNFCQVDTLNWGCTCQNKLPNSLPFQWPVVIAECNGKEKACEAECNGVTDDLCRQSCSNYYKCGKPGGQISHLRADQPEASSSSSSSSLSFSSTCHLLSSNCFIIVISLFFIIVL
ncbi:unnamed protein product [Cunninghamella blakesleeana]